jgi:hypothetical protein
MDIVKLEKLVDKLLLQGINASICKRPVTKKVKEVGENCRRSLFLIYPTIKSEF